MSTTVQSLIDQLDTQVQGFSTARITLWSTEELIAYINEICREFVLKTQILKLIDAIAAESGERIYDQNSYTSQIDRVAFNNTALDRTTKFSLDHQDIKWRTLAGIPRQYHQDQLPIQEFEVDRAPGSGQVGSGYTTIGLYGTLRGMLGGGRSVTDAAMTNGVALLNSATAAFATSDVGLTVFVAGAGTGGSTLRATILTINSATQVVVNVAPSATVSGATCGIGTPYSNSGNYGVFRYSYGSPAINGILPHGSPYSGTIRRMLTGLTNFEVMATRLVDSVENAADLLRVPDFCVLYIKYGVLYLMLAKEGEAQDMTRALYAKARYDRGIALFRKIQGVKTKDEVMARG